MVVLIYKSNGELARESAGQKSTELETMGLSDNFKWDHRKETDL